MKPFLILFLFTFIIAGSTPALAIPFSLDFGGLQNNEEVLSFYNGGLGSLGSGPGPSLGITFTSSFLVISAVPPPSAVPPLVGSLNGSSAIMDVAGGFNLLSFYYEASDNSGSVAVWSGLDGTGVMLSDITLAASSNWNPAGTFLGPTAHSAVFSGTPDTKFDLITDNGLVVPEPSTLLFFATGLLGLTAECRRRPTR